MKKLLFGLTLLIMSMSSFADGTLSCKVYMNGSLSDLSSQDLKITKEKRSIHVVGNGLAYYVDVLADGLFGEAYLKDKVTGMKAKYEDNSSGFVSKVGEDVEMRLTLSNENGGIADMDSLKKIALECSLEY